MHAVGRPGPWSLVSTSFLLALAGWLAVAAASIVAAPDLAAASFGAEWPVFFPLAVTGAAWHTLPVMLRNDLKSVQLLRVAVPLLGSGALLAVGVAESVAALTWAGTAFVLAGLAIAVREIAGLIAGAPKGKLLVASRAGVALSAFHLVATFVVGATVYSSTGVKVLGVPYERMVLVHLALAGLGWLTLLILAVGRTLAPMLALAPAPPPRRLPGLELLFTAGLWLLLAGLAAGLPPLSAAGGAVVALVLARFGLQIALVVRARRLDAVEGPLAHLAAGVFFLAQAAAFGFAALAGAVDARRGAAAFAVLLLVGWAAGVILGHLGKLLSLSAWSTWPPGPRPKQAALYPRRPWEAEALAFAAGAELLGIGVLGGWEAAVRGGAAVCTASALVAIAGALVTARRARAGRAGYRDSSASAAR
jgi:hypothetical protein